MRKMVQGTEHEYTLYCRKMGTMGFDPHMMALDLLRDSDLHLAGEFITNGSRVYYDVGHFEVSTAETTNFHDVVVWEKAGEKILDWLRRVMEEKYTGDMKIHAFKNNTSPDGTSYGSHENYCVSRDVAFPGQFIRDLVPHLATRIIYTGAGDIVRGKYVVSPIDVQRYYLEKVETIVQDDWEKRALRTFEEVLDGLENRRSKELAHRIEWLDRWFAIQEAGQKKAGPDVEMMACKQYSEIGAERSLFYKRQRAGLVDRITDDEAIKKAIQEPPKDTRAALRRELCDTFNIEMIDWSMLVVNDGTRRRIDLLDPYATKMEAPYATAS